MVRGVWKLLDGNSEKPIHLYNSGSSEGYSNEQRLLTVPGETILTFPVYTLTKEIR
jgi:hypothetical protein